MLSIVHYFTTGNAANAALASNNMQAPTSGTNSSATGAGPVVNNVTKAQVVTNTKSNCTKSFSAPTSTPAVQTSSTSCTKTNSSQLGKSNGTQNAKCDSKKSLQEENSASASISSNGNTLGKGLQTTCPASSPPANGIKSEVRCKQTHKF